MLKICYPETSKTHALRFELASNGVGRGHLDKGVTNLSDRFQCVSEGAGFSIDTFVEWAKKEASIILEGLEPKPNFIQMTAECPLITDYYLVDPDGIRRFLIATAADVKTRRVEGDYHQYRDIAEFGSIRIKLKDGRFRAFDPYDKYTLLQVETLKSRLLSGWSIKPYEFHAEVQHAGDSRLLPNLKWKGLDEYLGNA